MITSLAEPSWTKYNSQMNQLYVINQVQKDMFTLKGNIYFILPETINQTKSFRKVRCLFC